MSQSHRRRFQALGSEEGDVMAMTLASVIGDLRTSRRGAILDDFRSCGQILELFKQSLTEPATALGGGTPLPPVPATPTRSCAPGAARASRA